jgi:tRNA 2-thiouridine synthesizing protein A
MSNRETLDLRGITCPMNFVKAKLFIEEFEKGNVVEIILEEGDPLINVTRSLKEEGHKVIKVEHFDNYSFKLLVEKG